MMLTVNKILLALAVLVGAYLAGRAHAPKPLTVEKVVEVEKIVEVAKIVTKKEIIKPDGTVIKVDKVEDKKVAKESKQEAIKTAPVPLPDFRVGGTVQIGKDKPAYEIEIGRRLVGPVWGELEYDITRREVSVGLSLEF